MQLKKVKEYNMMDKVIDIIKSEPFYVPSILLKNYKKLNIDEKEFILLMYLINTDNSFNPKQISKDLDYDLNEAMNIINSLIEKDILKIDIVNNKVREEIINLDELYKKLAFTLINETKSKKTNLFDIFESEFGRTLSPIEYETISDWQKDFSDELILLALKEAVFNGVNSLRYIDKIIRDWDKKGIKTEEDVINDRKKFQEKKQEKKLFDYDWLNERDN
jgi:DNA replication protein